MSRISKPDIHSKVWGTEMWIANNEKYCGKMMVLKKGYRCSIHFHKIKDEAFFVTKGKMLVEHEVNGKMEKFVMKEGDALRILPHEKHRFTGLEDCVFFEFSTTHMEADSYRIVESGKVPDSEFEQILKEFA